MNIMSLVNFQEFNVLFLLWMEQLFLTYLLAMALWYTGTESNIWVVSIGPAQ